MELVTRQFIEIHHFEKPQKNVLFPHFYHWGDLIFKFYPSKNTNKKLKFGHNMHKSKTHLMQ